MCCRQRLDIAIDVALPPPPKQLRCFALPFFVWKWGRGGKLFGKARGVFFLKIDLIRLYVQSKMIFYYPFLETKTVEEAGSEHTNNVSLENGPVVRNYKFSSN